MLPQSMNNFSVEVNVTESDEPLVRQWLNEKWKHMKKMWSPIS